MDHLFSHIIALQLVSTSHFAQHSHLLIHTRFIMSGSSTSSKTKESNKGEPHVSPSATSSTSQPFQKFPTSRTWQALQTSTKHPTPSTPQTTHTSKTCQTSQTASSTSTKTRRCNRCGTVHAKLFNPHTDHY